MPDKPKLLIDWASHEASMYACKHWHYTGTMPATPCRVGAWENDRFIGVVLFGLGSGNATRGEKYGLARVGEIAELVRVALREHATPVTRIVAIALRMMKRENPDIRLVISFADFERQGHIGTIYQAGNWLYAGKTGGTDGYRLFGKRVHDRTIHSRGWKQSLEWLREHIDPLATPTRSEKHRYLMPMDAEMATRIEPMRQPFPKAAEVGDGRNPRSGGGSTPTQPLHGVYDV